jgi:hypothetical protein
MRINSKQRAACVCMVATTLAFPMSEALSAGRVAASGPRAGAVAHRAGPVLSGPGVARTGAPGGQASLPAGSRGHQARIARYGDFGVYGRRPRYGCGEGACSGGYWGGGGVFYG